MHIEQQIEYAERDVRLHKETLRKGTKSHFHEQNVQVSLRLAEGKLRRLKGFGA